MFIMAFKVGFRILRYIYIVCISQNYFTLYINRVCFEGHWTGTSLVVQWLRIHLPMQGTWV